MMRNSALLSLLLWVACAPGPEPTDRASIDDAVAAWSGGEIGLAEIESRFPEARTQACRSARQGGGSVELLIPCYREIAETLAESRSSGIGCCSCCCSACRTQQVPQTHLSCPHVPTTSWCCSGAMEVSTNWRI